ncbi:MAG TPA: hypothetical protein VGE41_02765 [Verrucomicrobiae bacterium]
MSAGESNSGAAAARETGELPRAWQPFTPRGVAAFSQAKYGRLFIVQFIAAGLAAGAVFWFLSTAWFPVVRQAIEALPTYGKVENQHLIASFPSTDPLAANRFLAFAANLESSANPNVDSDIALVLHTNSAVLCSIGGCLERVYPPGYTLQVNRPELEPWWGAWEPILLAMALTGVLLGLFLSWIALSTIYCGPIWFIAYFKDRKLTLVGSWKMTGAALLPGAFLLSAGIAAYGLGALDLPRLALLFAFHFFLGWVYCFWSMLALPRVAPARVKRGNPFTSPAEATIASDKDPSHSDSSGAKETQVKAPISSEPSAEAGLANPS